MSYTQIWGKPETRVESRKTVLDVPPQAEANFSESGSLSASRGDLRISRSEHRVDQQPDERYDKHADCPSDLSYSREIRSSEEHAEDRAHPHHQEEHDHRADKEPQEHAVAVTLRFGSSAVSSAELPRDNVIDELRLARA